VAPPAGVGSYKVAASSSMARCRLSRRFTPARSPYRPRGQKNGAIWWVRAPCTCRCARGRSGRRVRRLGAVGDSRFAVGDGLAVASAVGAFGEGFAVALDFADVGFSFVGVGGDGEQAVLAVVASKMRVTVWVSGFPWARAMMRGPWVSGQAVRGGRGLPWPGRGTGRASRRLGRSGRRRCRSSR
jgi:hypothetical protein